MTCSYRRCRRHSQALTPCHRRPVPASVLLALDNSLTVCLILFEPKFQESPLIPHFLCPPRTDTCRYHFLSLSRQGRVPAFPHLLSFPFSIFAPGSLRCSLSGHPLVPAPTVPSPHGGPRDPHILTALALSQSSGVMSFQLLREDPWLPV